MGHVSGKLITCISPKAKEYVTINSKKSWYIFNMYARMSKRKGQHQVTVPGALGAAASPTHLPCLHHWKRKIDIHDNRMLPRRVENIGGSIGIFFGEI